MKFIIGVGNPGRLYEKTRHNIGFRVIDAVKKRLQGQEVCLVKPSAYVNRTGDEVASVLKKHKANPADILIICDDVNLVFGKMRLRVKGSSGGHHGLQSVIDALATEEFARLRIGIQNESMPKDLVKFVLDRFSKDEEKKLKTVLEKAALVCEAWIMEGFKTAQNVISLKRESV